MKIRVDLKNENSFHCAVEDTVNELDNETSKEEIWDSLKKWVRYKECISVEFDTDTGTAIVLENKER